jgi:hypothetical protein
MWQTVMHAIVGRPTERHSNRTEKAEEEMTPHHQQAEALFEEFMGKPDDDTLGTEYVRKDITIAFAAFCLERRDNSKMQLAIKALKDIKNWDDDLEDEWGDPGERAKDALDKINP